VWIVEGCQLGALIWGRMVGEFLVLLNISLGWVGLGCLVLSCLAALGFLFFWTGWWWRRQNEMCLHERENKKTHLNSTSSSASSELRNPST